LAFFFTLNHTFLGHKCKKLYRSDKNGDKNFCLTKTLVFKIFAYLLMQGCALVFARISPLVLLRKTLGRALDCF